MNVQVTNLIVSKFHGVSAGYTNSNRPEIWFGPRTGGTYLTDFYNLFQLPGENQWPTVQPFIKNLETSIQWETDTDNSHLSLVVNGLAADNIGLGLDMLALVATSSCGGMVEGYASNGQSQLVAQTFNFIGANPAYFIMDEPIWYGHFYSGANACQSSISFVAANVASQIHGVRSVYPSMAIGQAEPISTIMSLDPTNMALPNLTSWFDSFESNTGTPLSFFRLDMDWTSNWQPFMVPVANCCHASGVQFQVIYNGLPNAGSADIWASQVLSHAAAVEALVIPDVAMFQSWNTYPSLNLPETTANSFTGIIKTYLGV